MKKILYIQPLHPSGMELLKEKYKVFTAEKEDKDYLRSIIGDCHAVVTRLTPIDRELIALCKRVVYLDKAMREARWGTRDEEGSLDFSGKTVGVIGLGRIGSKVAEIAQKGFHAKVQVFDPNLSKKKIEEKGYTCAADVDSLCKNSDFLTVHVPLTESTRDLIDGRRMALMKPTAYLANFSRGGIINERDCQ